MTSVTRSPPPSPNSSSSSYPFSFYDLPDPSCDASSSSTEPPVKSSFNRRKSVFAEQYDPSEEDDDEKLIYPKSDDQRKRLGEAVKNILLFRSLDQTEMSEVLDAMFERKVEAGEVVIKQGDDGDYFYVIEKGTFEFFVTGDDGVERRVGEYSDSGSFGELALMYNMPRSATAKASTPGSLWAMSRQTFRKIVLQRAYKKRRAYEILLSKVDMLKSLESYERMNLCDALTPKSYTKGMQIIKEGDEADGMYFLEEGTVRVTKTNEEGGKEREVSKLTSGSYFGELALITHKPRAANVYADTDVKVACKYQTLSSLLLFLVLLDLEYPSFIFGVLHDSTSSPVLIISSLLPLDFNVLFISSGKYF